MSVKFTDAELYDILTYALAKLNKSEIYLFSFLHFLKLKGDRGNTLKCVLSEFFRSFNSDFSVVCVSKSHCALATNYGRSAAVDIPANVSSFIEGFDAGEYPELVKNE